MAKACPDAVLDAALNYVAASDLLTVCSTQPTTYAQATDHADAGGYCLASHAMASGDFSIAAGSQRVLTIAAQAGITILHSGTALHVALTLAAGTTLRYVTTCTSQALTAGGTVDVPAWTITMAGPT
jgi:hypothetical protein